MPETSQAATQPAIPFAASEIVSRKLSELRTYPNNPNTHPPEQIDNLVALYREFGFTQPMLIDEDDMILAGHGRRLAALKMGLEEVPTIKRSGLTPAQKKAIVITDNQNAAMSLWDDDMLKKEVIELKVMNFDLSLLGFNDLKLVEFVSGLGDGQQQQSDPEGDGAEDRELTEAETKLLNDAWRKMVADWASIVARQKEIGFLSTSYTKGALAVTFMRSRLYGSAIPSAATLAYTPHRIMIKGDKDSLDSALKQTTDAMMASLRFVLQGAPKFDKLVGGTLAVQGCRLPGEFPADLARDLYDELCPKGGRVLDPCHGWGGRMLGFLLSTTASHYDGWDVDRLTWEGVRLMFKDLKAFAPIAKTAATFCQPFEEAKPKANSFDFALTSPPYFDVEKYGGDDSSWKRYSDFDKWVAGFYSPMITSVAKALKPGAVFALQVGNQSYPLEETAKTIAARVKLDYAETRHSGMINNYNKTEKQDGEVIVLFRKQRSPEI